MQNQQQITKPPKISDLIKRSIQIAQVQKPHPRYIKKLKSYLDTILIRRTDHDNRITLSITQNYLPEYRYDIHHFLLSLKTSNTRISKIYIDFTQNTEQHCDPDIQQDTDTLHQLLETLVKYIPTPLVTLAILLPFEEECCIEELEQLGLLISEIAQSIKKLVIGSNNSRHGHRVRYLIHNILNTVEQDNTGSTIKSATIILPKDNILDEYFTNDLAIRDIKYNIINPSSLQDPPHSKHKYFTLTLKVRFLKDIKSAIQCLSKDRDNLDLNCNVSNTCGLNGHHYRQHRMYNQASHMDSFRDRPTSNLTIGDFITSCLPHSKTKCKITQPSHSNAQKSKLYNYTDVQSEGKLEYEQTQQNAQPSTTILTDQTPLNTLSQATSAKY